MFEKIKIKIKNGRLTQYRIFNFPFIEIEKFAGGKFNIRFCFLKNKKPDQRKSLLYLKINAQNWCNIICLQKWIDIAEAMGSDYYILCDKEILEKEILKRVVFPDSNIKFLKSDRKTLKKEVNRICTPYWKNAGYAHLTTFLHAKKHKIEKFWDIDADDMIMSETPETIAKCLSNVSEVSDSQHYDLMSYDLLSSLWNHWCFGVTYISNNSKILRTIKETKNSDWRNKYRNIVKDGNFNIDWFFTYIRDSEELKIKSFVIENLYFSHIGVAFWALKYFFIAKNNCLIYPLYRDFCPEDKEKYAISISQNTIILNCNIDENNSKQELLKVFRDSINF